MDPAPSALVMGSKEGAPRIPCVLSCGSIGIIPRHSNKVQGALKASPMFSFEASNLSAAQFSISCVKPVKTFPQGESSRFFYPRNFAANSGQHTEPAPQQLCLPVPSFFLNRKSPSFSKHGFYFMVRKIIFQGSSLLGKTVSHHSCSIWFHFRNFLSGKCHN